MTTDIRVFNAYEWTRNRDDYNNFVNSVSKRVKNQVIAFYFDELGYEEDDVSLSANDDGDYICVNCGSNTFEYRISILIVE